MGYLVNLVVEGRSIVVVGGGRLASRKTEDLLRTRANVTVIATHPCQNIRALAEAKRIVAAWRPYRTGDLQGAFLAVAATDDEAVNAQVAKDAQALNILVNVVDRPALCTFTVPSTVRRGDLTFAVATEGRCPSLAAVLREELEDRYGPEYRQLINLFGGLRKQMIAMGWDGPRIRGALSEIYRDGAIEVIAAGDDGLLIGFLRSRLGPGFRLP